MLEDSEHEPGADKGKMSLFPNSAESYLYRRKPKRNGK